ncbi:MAG: hypothetical protein Q8L98_01575 [Chlamydiales bacterium]|nr:hypothetical protein [Chlamydiales bacterium]
MAVAVFGLTACISGVLSCQATKFICEESDRKYKKNLEEFVEKRAYYEQLWKTWFQGNGWQNPQKAVNWDDLSQTVELLTPLCPHIKINKSKKECPRTFHCGLLRKVISLEIALTQVKLSPYMKLEETQLYLCSLVAAIALTIFTSAIIPLNSPLMTMHLLLGLGAAYIGTRYAIRKKEIS